MGLETGVTYIEDLVSTNPVGATDNVDEGDDHIRNIKTAVKGSFPNLGAAAVTKTAAQINTTQDQVVPATTNNLAMLDASGDLADSLVESDGAGNITANVTGNLIGDVTGDVTGNADTATNFDSNRTFTATGGNVNGTSAATDDGNYSVSLLIDANAVAFSYQMNDVTTNYDFTFSTSNTTQLITAGIYNIGKAVTSTGALSGTLKLQVKVDGSWYDYQTIAKTGTSTAIDANQITSNGADARFEWTYATGSTTGTFRLTKIFA